MSRPIQHHYVPEFYLEGFTEAGTASDQLHVLDLETGKSWKQLPGQAARIRGFYAADIPGFDPNEAEKGLSRVENIIAPVIRKIRKTGVLPEDQQSLDALLNFIALSVARVPKFRKIMATPLIELAKKIMAESVATPEAYESFKQDVRATGRKPSEDYEAAKQFYESGEYEIDADPATHLQNLLLGTEKVLGWVSRFVWFLEVACDGAPDFVTSDCPVVMIENARHWEDCGLPIPSEKMPTEIVMPLSRRLSLWGFAARRGFFPAPMPADARLVSSFNTFIVAQAERYVFSSSGEITWGDSGSSLGTTESLLRRLRDEQRDRNLRVGART